MVMNKNFFAGLFVGLSLLAIFAFRPAGNEKPSAVQKWEYKVVRGESTLVSAQSKLDEMGAQGWELVSVLDYAFQFYKRPAE
jgi:hypothetical protein